MVSSFCVAVDAWTSKLPINYWDNVLHHFLRAVVEGLGQCHCDGEPLVLCPSTWSPLPTTPRCAAADAFILHSTTSRVSTRLTVRVDLDFDRPSHGLLEPSRCSSCAFLGFLSVLSVGLFWRSLVAKVRAPHHDHGRGRGRLTTCEIASFKRAVLTVIFVVCIWSVPA